MKKSVKVRLRDRKVSVRIKGKILFGRKIEWIIRPRKSISEGHDGAREEDAEH